MGWIEQTQTLKAARCAALFDHVTFVVIVCSLEGRGKRRRHWEAASRAARVLARSATLPERATLDTTEVVT